MLTVSLVVNASNWEEEGHSSRTDPTGSWLKNGSSSATARPHPNRTPVEKGQIQTDAAQVCLYQGLFVQFFITIDRLSYSQANVRNVPTPTPPPPPIATPSPAANPYSVAGKDGQGATGFDGAPRERGSRSFRFNPKGKYVALANQQRQEAQLEALKQRIAESARKAGLDGDMGIEKTIKVCLVHLVILYTIIKQRIACCTT